MAKELILEVVARKNSRELNALADDFEKAARKAETAGKSFDKTASFSKHLDTEIAKTKTSIKELGQEFDRTGNKDVFAKLRGAQGNLRGLENIKKQLSTAIEKGGDDGAKSLFQRLTVQGKSMGKEFGNLFEGGLGGALRSPAGIGVVVAAAGAVGNAMFAAMLTGTGLAAIAAGIVGQLKDPRVKAAGGQLGKDVSAGFKDATSSFAQPLVTSLYQFDREWAKLQPGLKATFTQLSPLVLDLSKGTVGFVDNLVPALERAAVASKPLIQDLAVYLPTLGRELGGLFDSLGRNSNNLVSGLHELESTLDGVVKTATVLVPVVSQVGRVFGSAHYLLGPAGFAFQQVSLIWDAMQGRTGPLLVRAMADASGAADQFGQAAKNDVVTLDALNQKLGQTQVTFATVAGTMSDKVFSALMSVDQANLSVAESLTKVAEAVKKNGQQLDIHTAKGQANRQAVLAAVQANIQEYDSLIQAGAGADQAAAAYNQNTAALERQLRKAGLTSAQIDGLIGKYRNVPGKVNTIMAVQGLTDALNRLTNLIEKLNGLDGQRINTYVVTHFSSTGKQLSGGTGQSRGSGFAQGGYVIPDIAAAKGLIYRPSNPPLIKFAEPETGGEAYIPRRGIPAAQGLALANVAAGWFGGEVTYGGGRMRSGWGGGVPTVRVVVEDTSGQVLVDKIVRFAMDTNRTPASLFPASSR